MLNQLRQLWEGLDNRARRVIITAVALCVGGLVVLTRLSSGVALTPLYTGLAPEDAAQIVERLKTEGITYRLGAGGASVSVPQEKVYELRIAMAKEGLPASGQVGFELFDRSSLPGTQFNNQVNYQRALQGELARTISAMDEVRVARVHLVLPEESLFTDKTKASAAVVLQPESGRELTPELTGAVAHIVASAVKDVPASEVTVVDTTGRVLHGPDPAGNSGALAGTQLAVRQQYEERLARSLQTMLDSVLGPSQAVVRVRADLDFDSQEVRTEAVLPPAGGRGVVTSEKLKEEQYQGSREGAGEASGAAGLEANLTTPGQARREGRAGSYVQRDQTREYQYSRNSTAVVKAPGRVKSLSVAAIIDEDLPAAAEEQVRDLLTAAAGANAQRGDLITVQRMKIQAAETAQTQEAEMLKQERGQRTQALLHTALRSGMSLVAAVILFLTAQTVMRQMRPATGHLLEPAPEGVANRVEMETLRPEPEALPEEAPVAERPVLSPSVSREQLRRLAQTDTQAVADRLLAMLQEQQAPSRG